MYIYSPTAHTTGPIIVQTWHDDGPPPKRWCTPFSKVKVKGQGHSLCIYTHPTAHTTGPIMTKPGMMMVPTIIMT